MYIAYCYCNEIRGEKKNCGKHLKFSMVNKVNISKKKKMSNSNFWCHFIF